MRYSIEVDTKEQNETISNSNSQAYSWHSTPPADALLHYTFGNGAVSMNTPQGADSVLGTLEDPRTHNLYLYLQNDPLNNIDPSGHILVAGGGGGSGIKGPQQPNCARCNNGRNIPTPALMCTHCGRRRPVQPPPPPPPQQNRCRECGRVGCNRQCLRNRSTSTAPRAPSGGSNQTSNNASRKTMAAEVKTRKKNSSAIPNNNQGQSGIRYWQARATATIVRPISFSKNPVDLGAGWQAIHGYLAMRYVVGGMWTKEWVRYDCNFGI